MNLLKALATVSGMTLISRVLGLVRRVDCPYLRRRHSHRRVFRSVSHSQPAAQAICGRCVLASIRTHIRQYKNRRTLEETQKLVNHVATLLFIVLFLVTLIGVIASPWIIYISAPGFAASPDKFALTIELLRITFPYILFISLVSLAGGVLNTFGKYSVPALTPALLNLSFIACAVWLAPRIEPPVMALAWAVFIGGLLQLAFQVPFLIRIRFLPRPRIKSADIGAWRVIRQMGPAVFGVSIGQISLLINTIFASFLITGSVSWLYYADRLMEFPAGLLGAALGNDIAAVAVRGTMRPTAPSNIRGCWIGAYASLCC